MHWRRAKDAQSYFAMTLPLADRHIIFSLNKASKHPVYTQVFFLLHIICIPCSLHLFAAHYQLNVLLFHLKTTHTTIDIPAKRREEYFESFISGQSPLLVCTDIFSRGLDTTAVRIFLNTLSKVVKTYNPFVVLVTFRFGFVFHQQRWAMWCCLTSHAALQTTCIEWAGRLVLASQAWSLACSERVRLLTKPWLQCKHACLLFLNYLILLLAFLLSCFLLLLLMMCSIARAHNLRREGTRWGDRQGQQEGHWPSSGGAAVREGEHLQEGEVGGLAALAPAFAFLLIAIMEWTSFN